MIEALLEAVRDQLRTVPEFDEHHCDVQPQGHPPHTMGDFYVSIDEGPISNPDRGMLREYYTVDVWVSLRAGLYPDDRRRNMYLAGSRKLTGLERLIIPVINGSEDVRRAANVIMGISEAAQDGDATAPGGDGSFGDPISGVLWYQGRGPTELKGPEWIGESEDGATFQVRRLQFHGAWRVQSLANQK